MLREIPDSPNYTHISSLISDDLDKKVTGYYPKLIGEFLSENFGMSSFHTIILTSIILKLAIIPLSIWQQKIQYRKKKVNPQREKLQLDLKEAYQQGLTRKTFAAMQRLNEFDEKNAKVSAIQIFKPISVQLFAYMGGCYFVRCVLTNPKIPSTIDYGLWFKNLLEPDPYLILPVLSSSFMSLNAYILNRGNKPPIINQRATALQKVLVKILRYSFLFPFFSLIFTQQISSVFHNISIYKI